MNAKNVKELIVIWLSYWRYRRVVVSTGWYHGPHILNFTAGLEGNLLGIFHIHYSWILMIFLVLVASNLLFTIMVPKPCKTWRIIVVISRNNAKEITILKTVEVWLTWCHNSHGPVGQSVGSRPVRNVTGSSLDPTRPFVDVQYLSTILESITEWDWQPAETLLITLCFVPFCNQFKYRTVSVHYIILSTSPPHTSLSHGDGQNKKIYTIQICSKIVRAHKLCLHSVSEAIQPID